MRSRISSCWRVGVTAISHFRDDGQCNVVLAWRAPSHSSFLKGLGRFTKTGESEYIQNRFFLEKNRLCFAILRTKRANKLYYWFLGVRIEPGLVSFRPRNCERASRGLISWGTLVVQLYPTKRRYCFRAKSHIRLAMPVEGLNRVELI